MLLLEGRMIVVVSRLLILTCLIILSNSFKNEKFFVNKSLSNL
jgi:hypothetical protein